ncbi:MAG: hypothetical protein HS126_18920 [Anaerolineales bacterium]|nr:hypothetical protein [Anaerolineales bacterium]
MYRLFGYLLFLVLLSFLFWHRRPPGRGTSDPGSPNLKNLTDFDTSNPHAPQQARNFFYNGVQAHLDGDLNLARSNYLGVLNYIPNEPNTLYNLDQI